MVTGLKIMHLKDDKNKKIKRFKLKEVMHLVMYIS